MKFCLLCIVIASALQAQLGPQGAFTPDTVVAKIDGKDVTVADVQKAMRGWPPEVMQQYQTNPVPTMQSIFMTRYLAAEANKLQLGEDQLWKEQIETATDRVLVTAMLTYEHDHFSVSEKDVLAYYERNKSRYQQATIKIVKIGFKEPIPAGSVDDVKRAAQIAVQNEHAPNRSEADAKVLAADIVKQFRAGTDFAELVKKYSDDDESKAVNGFYGRLTPASPYPDEMKKAIFALKTGDLSDPVRQPNALYIIHIDDMSFLSIDAARAGILTAIEDDHIKAYGVELNKRFAPVILKPEFFLPTGPAPQAKKP
jgi:peptidyl-prolyl cis-trans isomerase C